MDLKELAAKYITYHNNPLTKVDLPTMKFFLDDPNQQKCIIEKYQNILGESLNYVRVDRRCARSKGIWIDGLNLCKITKVVGPILRNFGFQDKRGIFLIPEEALFLLEQNRLELTFNNTQISISEAYDLLLTQSTLKTYRVYKKLVGQGFRLLNKEAITKFYSKNIMIDEEREIMRAEKRKIGESEWKNSEKLRKIVDLNKSLIESTKKTNTKIISEVNFQDIFQKLRNKGPESIFPEKASYRPDYFGFLPSSTIKHRHEFNLYIREEINFKNFGIFEDIPNIVAICSNDNIAFYRFPNVNISVLT